MEESASNFERMIALVNEVFDTRSDPSQLQVDEQVIEQLQLLHPSTLTEYDDGHGPAIWILMIPTSRQTMEQFIAGKITEAELMEETKQGQSFEAIYLCSATVLPEYRRKGMALKLCMEAIADISKAHPIKSLYVWPFTPEGNALANKISDLAKMPLFVKSEMANN